jgi:hypothetical protein
VRFDMSTKDAWMFTRKVTEWSREVCVIEAQCVSPSR